MDISQATDLPENSPCTDKHQPQETRQTSGIGSIEKLLSPDLMQTPEKINILGIKTSEDMNVSGVNEAFDQPTTSSMMQNPETNQNPETILVTEVLPALDAKNTMAVFDGNQLQPEELHAEILLDRPGPSEIRTFPEFEQSADVMGPLTPMSSSDVVCPGIISTQGEPTQRSSRDTVREILSLLSGYTHGIPYPITRYYLESAGFNNFSPEIVQLVGLTAQKYIYDILCDAMENTKQRLARENAARGGSSTAPLSLAYADLAPALMKHRDNRNLNFMKKNDLILESFRNLLKKRNINTEIGGKDITIEKMEEFLGRIYHFYHKGNNEDNLSKDESNESDESDDESTSTSERHDESQMATSSTTSSSIPAPNLSSISTSSLTTFSSSSSSTSADHNDDYNDVDEENSDDDNENYYCDRDDDNDYKNGDDNDCDGDDDNDINGDVNNDDCDGADDNDRIDCDGDDDKVDSGDDNVDSKGDDDNDSNGDDNVDSGRDADNVDSEGDSYDYCSGHSSDNDDTSATESETSFKRRKLRNSNRLEKRVEELINIFTKLSTSNSSEEDECDKFGALLAEKLRTLDIEHREEIMSEIIRLLLVKTK